MIKLYHGLCEELMNEIPDNSIDLILCDLPYETTDLKWDKKISFDVLWQNYNRVKKTNTPIVLFSCQPFTTHLIHSNLKQYKYNWYWIKNNITGFCFAKYQPMRCVEDVCVFYEKAPVFNVPLRPSAVARNRRDVEDCVYKLKSLSLRHYYQKNTGYPDNVLYFNGDDLGGVERFHPTQKPIKILEFLIRTYTKVGGTVLDNTMGSGSTGVAAVNTGRHFIGIEKEKKYFDIAEKRIKEAEIQNSSNLFDVATLEGGVKAPPPCRGDKSERYF